MQKSVLNLAFNFLRNYAFKGLLYSETWEDYDVDKKALRIKPSDVLLCITSGGAFPLNSALESPKVIYSVDSNKVQNFILELKLAAIKNLDYETNWRFLTTKSFNSENLATYNCLRAEFSPEARQFFDRNKTIIHNGILNNGMLHFALDVLNKYVRLTVGTPLINKLFNARSIDEQAAIYKTHIERRLWNPFSNNLSISSMLLYGVSPAQIELLKRNGVETIRQLYKKQIESVFASTLLKDNFFWAYIIFKEYSAQASPPYLQKRNFARLQKNISKIRIINDDALSFLKRQPEDHISKMSFSDILDWDHQKAQSILNEAVRAGKRGAILAFRSELGTFNVENSRLAYHAAESHELALQEKTGSYSGYFKYSLRK